MAAGDNGRRQGSGMMHCTRTMTGSSGEQTRRAGTSMESITRTVSSLHAMNQQIAAAAEQHSSVADEISRSIVNVRDVSEQTADASEDTAAPSVALARLGRQLQTTVSHSRVCSTRRSCPPGLLGPPSFRMSQPGAACRDAPRPRSS
ncbi:methyl-accepting chemotaxis protein, partial [Pseudomonas syringae]